MDAFSPEAGIQKKLNLLAPQTWAAGFRGVSIHLSLLPALDGDLHVTSGVPITLSETIKRTADLWPGMGLFIYIRIKRCLPIIS